MIVHHQVHIQGVGPGGFDPAGTYVPGSIIDGAGFNPDNPSGTDWIDLARQPELLRRPGRARRALW